MPFIKRYVAPCEGRDRISIPNTHKIHREVKGGICIQPKENNSSTEISTAEAGRLSEELVAPCGTYCGTCTFLNRKEKPSCSGCGNQKGHLFWGECKLYACATGRVEHCGICEEFPCDLFVNQFDPAHGQKSVLTRAGLLAYRRRVGTQKFIEMSEKLDKDEKRK
jgi:hypothetical protein